MWKVEVNIKGNYKESLKLLKGIKEYLLLLFYWKRILVYILKGYISK